MRLRRETGDFQIVWRVVDDAIVVDPIRSGLSAEDFVGQVLKGDEGDNVFQFTVVTEAIEGYQPGIVNFTAVTGDGNITAFTYDQSTGVITAVTSNDFSPPDTVVGS